MFAEKLKELRQQKGLSQEDLAKMLGYSRTTISAYELARNEPSFNDLKKIAAYFNVSTDYLLGSDYPLKFEYKLRYLMLAQSISTLQLAEKIAASSAEVTKWLNGSEYPPSNKIIEVASVLGVTVDYLLYEKNNVPFGHVNLSDKEYNAVYLCQKDHKGEDISIDDLEESFPNISEKIKKSISSSSELEILKRKFVKHGIIKEDEDLTSAQLDDYLKKLSTIINAFKD